MFFKDIDDFNTCLPLQYALAFPQISIYLNEIDRSVYKEYLGKDFLAVLQTEFDAKNNFDLIEAPYKSLIDSLRVHSANLAFVKWMPLGQVHASQSGIQIHSSDNLKIPFQWQLEDIKDTCNETAYVALEDALEYLLDNINETEFSVYKSSSQFKENNYLFVPSANEFSKYYSSFKKSHVNFFKLRSIIRTVEDFQIKGILLPDLFNDIKTKLQAGETLGTYTLALIELIKPALVNLTIAKGINDLSINIDTKGMMSFDNTGGRVTQETKKQTPDLTLARIADTAEKTGLAYLKKLEDYLEKEKDNYPLFKNDATYTEPAENIDLNDGSKPFFTGL